MCKTAGPGCLVCVGNMSPVLEGPKDKNASPIAGWEVSPLLFFFVGCGDGRQISAVLEKVCEGYPGSDLVVVGELPW